MNATDRLRLSPAMRVYMVGNLISSLGTGLVLPFNAIFLRDERHYSVAATSAALFVIAAFAATSGFAGGSLGAQRGIRGVTVIGVVAVASGFAAFGTVDAFALVLLAAALIGLGNGLLLVTRIPTIAHHTSESERPHAFSVFYWTMNAGLGIGAVLGGILTGALGRHGYAAVYVANAVSFVALGAVLVRIAPPRVPDVDRAATSSRRYLGLLQDRVFVVLLSFRFLGVTFGFVQLESGIPLFLRTHFHFSNPLVGAMIAVNTAAVIVLQVPLGRQLARRDKPALLVVQSLTWAAAFCCGLLAVAAPTGLRTVLVVLVFIVVAVGECLFSLAFSPLLTQVAPGHLLSLYSGAMASAYGAGAMLGPALAVWLVATGTTVLWLVLIVACVGMAAMVHGAVPLLREREPPSRSMHGRG